MRYVDTSVLIAYLTPEKNSEAAERLMLSQGLPLAVSSWTEAELLSALGIKWRSGQLSESAANLVLDTYCQAISPQLRHLAVEDAHHRRATALLHGWKTTLGAVDSLHLAIAAAYSATIYTLDRGMAQAAAAHGIAVVLLAE